ncbi:hypothetical protein EON64_07760 [archaeon]|nr:MAG: hypothetical protein EON64_07760 [archaeon]
MNTILEEPQPFFFLIKKMYPHYHAGRGRQGHLIYWERPGDFEGSQLSARGVTTEHLIRHWLFNTEYQWQVRELMHLHYHAHTLIHSHMRAHTHTLLYVPCACSPYPIL